MRASLPSHLGKKNHDPVLSIDVFRSFSATLPTPPSFSIGIKEIKMPVETSQEQYTIKSTMDPSGHPTVPKHCGARFGSEVLETRDPPGPAPGNYEDGDAAKHSSTIKKLPNFTIQGRESWKPPTAAPGPGIGSYDFSQALRTGKLTPIRWTHQGKEDPLRKPLGSKQYQTPGPDHYKCPGAGAKVNPTKYQSPLWKFGSESRGLR